MKSALKSSGMYPAYRRVRKQIGAVERWFSQRKYTLSGVPYCINVELTNRCNLSCSYCPQPELVSSGQLKATDMDFELFQLLVNQVEDLQRGTRALDLASFTPVGLGEPLMYGELANALDT